MNIIFRRTEDIAKKLDIPDADTVEIWSVNIIKDSDMIRNLFCIMDMKEVTRYSRYLRKNDRLRFAGGRIYTKLISAGYLGIDAADINICAQKYHKPVIGGHEYLRYNISHSGEWILLAFSSAEVGIDIEKYDPCINAAELSKIFHPKEQKVITEGDSAAGFYKIWTAKEAYVKATGKGFSKAPESFFIDNDGRVHDLNELSAERYKVERLGGYEGYIATLCYKIKEESI